MASTNLTNCPLQLQMGGARLRGSICVARHVFRVGRDLDGDRDAAVVEFLRQPRD